MTRGVGLSCVADDAGHAPAHHGSQRLWEELPVPHPERPLAPLLRTAAEAPQQADVLHPPEVSDPSSHGRLCAALAGSAVNRQSWHALLTDGIGRPYLGTRKKLADSITDWDVSGQYWLTLLMEGIGGLY